MKYHFPFLFWMIAIFVQSSFPSEFFPETEILNVDKLFHMAVFGLLALFCYISLIHQYKIKFWNSKPLLFSLIICSLYGISDEYHQAFVPNRSSEFVDWLSDFAGIIITILIIKYYLQKHYSLFKPKYINNLS
ncbi:MAG: VanZ family protein [Ignavibacteria bacterium]